MKVLENYRLYTRKGAGSESAGKLQIVHKKGDIFPSPQLEPLAHCVSADCAYGAGIAVTFKDKYGVEKVRQQNKKPGQCAVTHEEDGRTIFHLITKRKCTDLPTYEDFTNSLKHMRDWCVEHKVKSVSAPPAGVWFGQTRLPKSPGHFERSFYRSRYSHNYILIIIIV